MPLQDHFHPPLSVRRHWHAFHNAWATFIASDLNRKLPSGYFAEPNVQFGIEIDVATFEESQQFRAVAGPSGVPDAAWTPPAPSLTIPFTLVTDIVEVAVYDTEAGPVLAGAIELVSPANKDRPENCDSFVAKCAAYLQQGVGLVVVDVVTSRKKSLHGELLSRFDPEVARGHLADLYAAAYRPVERDEQTSLDIWHDGLTVGRSLPKMPLWLLGGLCLPVDLNSTYERTCLEQRLVESA
jgi:hypothetical protein